MHDARARAAEAGILGSKCPSPHHHPPRYAHLSPCGAAPPGRRLQALPLSRSPTRAAPAGCWPGWRLTRMHRTCRHATRPATAAPLAAPSPWRAVAGSRRPCVWADVLLGVVACVHTSPERGRGWRRRSGQLSCSSDFHMPGGNGSAQQHNRPCAGSAKGTPCCWRLAAHARRLTLTLFPEPWLSRGRLLELLAGQRRVGDGDQSCADKGADACHLEQQHTRARASADDDAAGSQHAACAEDEPGCVGFTSAGAALLPSP